MSDYRTRATVDLDINGATARREITEQKKLIQDLRESYRQALIVGDPKMIKKTEAELRAARKELRAMQSDAKTAAEVMRRLSEASPKELRDTLRQLKKELNNIPRGSDSWNSQIEKIREVQEELDKVNSALKPDKTVSEKVGRTISDWKDKFAGLAAGATKVFGVMKRSVEDFADMDQEMANVRKYTGMSAEEVERLNEEFKKIDTRSSREQLNVLAQEAGRLGKTSVEDVLGFVRAADKINVALDDLGDGATLELSKLAGVFGVEQSMGTEKALLSVGSVVNELSQNCAASAPYITDFTSRLGGVGAQAGMTIPQIMSFAAVLDASGQQVESSATALSQLIVHLIQDPAKYAETAGINVKQFTELLKTDANAAVIQFLESLNKAGKMDVLAPMFADMGEKGSRSVAVLATLAGKIDEIKSQQIAANEAFIEATSIDKEFQVQNETLQANLEKMHNNLHEIWVTLGSALAPMATIIIDKTKGFATALATTIRFLGQHKNLIAAAVAGYAAYQIAVNLVAIKKTALMVIDKAEMALLKAKQVLLNAGIIAYYACAAAVNVFKGNLAAAKTQIDLIKGAINETPLGLFATVITAAATALIAFSNSSEDANEKIKAMADATENATLKRAEAEQQVARDILRIEKFNGTKQQEIDLINELNGRYGPLLGTYKTLGDWLNTLKKRGTEYCNVVYNQMLMEGKLEAARQMIAKAARLREEAKNEDPGFWATFAAFTRRDWGSKGNMWKGAKEDARRNKIAENEAEAQRLESNARALTKEAMSGDASAPFQTETTYSDEPAPSAAPSNKKRGGGSGRGRGRNNSNETAENKKIAEELKNIKTQSINKETELTTQYQTGALEMDYQTFLKKINQIKLDFYDESMKYLKNHNREESAEYAQFARDRQQEEEKFAKNQLALKKEVFDRKLKIDETEENARFNAIESPSIAEEVEHQNILSGIKVEYYKNLQAMYKKGDKEYQDYQLKIDDETEENSLRLKERYMQLVSEMRKKYDRQDNVEKFKIEKAALDVLLKEGKITQEEYSSWIGILSDETKRELAGFEETSAETRDRIIADAKKELKAALEAGIITQEEYAKRMNAVTKSSNSSGKMSGGSDWGGMFVDMYSGWDDLLNNEDKSPEAMAKRISTVVATTTSMITAAMETVSQFMQAEMERQEKLIEKRYGREIELAEGNTFTVKNLEQRKQQEIARLKSEAAKKQFAIQVAQTIAQTAQNAVSAYGAGLSVGGPAGLVLGPVAAALAVAQGALQLALLQKQQQAASAGYSEGGFTPSGDKDTPVGVVHAGEWVAPQKLLKNPQTRPMIEMLDYARTHNTLPQTNALNPQTVITQTAAVERRQTEKNNNTQQQTIAVTMAAAQQLSEAAGRMTDRLNQPFTTVNTVTGEFGSLKAQQDYERMINNKSYKK